MERALIVLCALVSSAQSLSCATTWDRCPKGHAANFGATKEAIVEHLSDPAVEVTIYSGHHRSTSSSNGALFQYDAIMEDWDTSASFGIGKLRRSVIEELVGIRFGNTTSADGTVVPTSRRMQFGELLCSNFQENRWFMSYYTHAEVDYDLCEFKDGMPSGTNSTDLEDHPYYQVAEAFWESLAMMEEDGLDDATKFKYLWMFKYLGTHPFQQAPEYSYLAYERTPYQAGQREDPYLNPPYTNSSWFETVLNNTSWNKFYCYAEGQKQCLLDWFNWDMLNSVPAEISIIHGVDSPASQTTSSDSSDAEIYSYPDYVWDEASVTVVASEDTRQLCRAGECASVPLDLVEAVDEGTLTFEQALEQAESMSGSGAITTSTGPASPLSPHAQLLSLLLLVVSALSLLCNAVPQDTLITSPNVTLNEFTTLLTSLATSGAWSMRAAVPSSTHGRLGPSVSACGCTRTRLTRVRTQFLGVPGVDSSAYKCSRATVSPLTRPSPTEGLTSCCSSESPRPRPRLHRTKAETEPATPPHRRRRPIPSLALTT